MKKRIFKQAKELLKDPARLLDIVTQAWNKAYAKRTALFKIFDEFLTLFRLLKAWALNEYPDISKKSLLFALGAVLYFLSPLDFFPDLFPGGFIDDVAVVSYVLARIKPDLDKFLAWEKSQKA